MRTLTFSEFRKLCRGYQLRESVFVVFQGTICGIYVPVKEFKKLANIFRFDSQQRLPFFTDLMDSKLDLTQINEITVNLGQPYGYLVPVKMYQILLFLGTLRDNAEDLRSFELALDAVRAEDQEEVFQHLRRIPQPKLNDE